VNEESIIYFVELSNMRNWCRL